MWKQLRNKRINLILAGFYTPNVSIVGILVASLESLVQKKYPIHSAVIVNFRA